jgi:hypothetical protein
MVVLEPAATGEAGFALIVQVGGAPPPPLPTQVTVRFGAVPEVVKLVQAGLVYVTVAPRATKAEDTSAMVSAAATTKHARDKVNDLAIFNIAKSPSECIDYTRETILPLPSGYHFWWQPSATSRCELTRVDTTQRSCPAGNSRRDYDVSIARPRTVTSRIHPGETQCLRWNLKSAT